MFKISDGRDHLYQWDIDDTLNLVGTGAAEINEVHFCHKCTQQPLTVAVDHTGDVPIVQVPNILLQKSNSIIVHAFCRGEDAEYTRCGEIIKVEPRPKPADYVYTETEVLSYKKLAEKFAEKVNELSQKLDNLQISGLTTEQVNALDGMFQKCAYTDEVSAEYEAFKTAFGIGTESGGDETATLSSISATYTGGDVAVGTALTSLTGITVTGTYSDGSTSEITGYTISGEIVEGSNTITVTYDGKTTTFTVTGVAEEEEEPLYGVYWQPSPTQPWINADLETNGYVYSGNTGEYIDVGFPGACAVKINEKLQGHIYIRTLTKNQYAIDDAYRIYVNDDGELSTGGFTQLTYTRHNTFNGVTETIEVDGTTYYFTMYEWTIPSDKVGIFVSLANPMTNGNFISADKISIDVEYQQYYTLFVTDPTDRITEGATEVTA